MSNEQNIVQESVEEEQAPALPTTEPPRDDVGKPVEVEVTEAPKVEEKPEEAPKDEKPATRIFKRPTLKWGKKRDEPSGVKEPEQAKDIRDDALGWIAQQIPPAVHKVNYHLLDWAQKLAYEESEPPALPGKDGSVTRNQFLSHLRDGKLLVNLANKLQPGSISVEPEATVEAAPISEQENTAEGPTEGDEKKQEAAVESVKAEEKRDTPAQKTEKEKQYEMVDKFTTWVKDCLGLGEGKAMTAADLLEKGKAGYPAVFETLWQLALKAQEKFQREGIDVDAVVASASQVVRTNIIQTILNFFKRRPSPASDKKDSPAEPAAGDSAPNAPEGEQVVEEECKKIDTLTSAPVAAN